MGQTIKRYPVVEVALRCHSSAPLASGHERALEGDIICARPPHTGVGFMEMYRFLWLRLSGWEEDAFGSLGEVVDGFEKRRYSIPLKRLKAVVPSFDVAKALDTTQVYQPFLSVDEDTGLFVSQTKPLDAHGLVYDAVTRRFL